MHIIRIFIAITLFFSFSELRANDPQIANDELPGLKVARNVSYETANLIDYLNDNAMIYYEYGFIKLNKQTLIFDDEVIQVEVAQMGEGKGAFGLFSLYRKDCPATLDYVRNSCLDNKLLTFSISNWYVKIENRSGTETARNLSSKIAELIYNKSTKECFALPRELSFDIFQNQTNKLIFVNGARTLSAALPEWKNYFNGIDIFSMYVLSFASEKSTNARCALIQFRPGADIKTFVSNLGLKKGKNYKKKTLYKANGKYAVTIDKATLYYIESTGEDKAVEPLLKEMVK